MEEALLARIDGERARLETILQAIPSGVVVADAPNGEIRFANEAARAIAGDVGARLAGSLQDAAGARPGSSEAGLAGSSEWPLVRTIQSGEAVEADDLHVPGPDGLVRRIRVSSAPIHDAEGRLVAGVAVFDDVTRQEVAHEQASFLAEASGVLGASLDAEETIARVARLAVPTVADWCAVEVVDDSGRVDLLALEHVDPGRVDHLRELRRRADAAGDRATASSRVIRTGRPELVAAVGAEHVAAAVPEGEIRSATEALALSSYLCVPLTVAGQVIGTLTLATEGPARRLTEPDLAFAEVLAGRVAIAIENARLYADSSRLRMVLDTIDDAVDLFDPRTLRITYVNDGMVRQLGRTREELVRLTPCDITVGLSPVRLRELIAPLLDGSMTSRTVDIIRRAADGTPIPVEVRYQRVRPRGESPLIAALARDIRDRLGTERRLGELAQAEHARAAELNAMIRAIGEGLLVIDRSGAIRLANPTARALFATSPLRDLTDVATALVLPDGAAADALLAATSPLALERADGKGWVEVTAYPVDEHVVTGAGETILIVRDITAARERERVRDAFVGVLSHELRTPVTTIFGGAKVLARDGGNLGEDARREIFEDIHSEAERLHRLVEDVVALTRFGEGAFEIGQEPVLLQRVLPSVTRSEETRWPGGLFELDIQPDLPPVSGDQTYVEQVVRNLLANAVKYGERSVVRVAARRQDGEVVVRVVDSGPGFPEDEARRLFELYYRSPSVERRIAGSGLGLFVCARLIDAMGGRIWASNRAEGGAEFGFALRSMGEGH
jgi:PAS domain S-box-containing protein